VAFIRIPPDALGPAKPADESHVNLNDVDAAHVHHLAEFFDIANLLAGRDADRTLSAEPGIYLDVVRVQRLFQPSQVEFLELPGTTDGSARIPAQTAIDHSFDVLAQTLTGGAHLGPAALL